MEGVFDLVEIFESVDLYNATAIHGLSSSCGKVLTIPQKIITLSGNWGLSFIVMLFFKATRKTGITALIALAAGALLTNVILKNVIARPRPFADVSSKYYEFWKSTGSLSKSGYSFPSGHTTAATAFGIVLFLLKNKKYSWVFSFIPVATGFTRIYFTVHYASDIFGGFFVGVTAALFAYFTIKHFVRTKNFINCYKSPAAIYNFNYSATGCIFPKNEVVFPKEASNSATLSHFSR